MDSQLAAAASSGAAAGAASSAANELRLVAAGKLIPQKVKKVKTGGDDAFFVSSAGLGALGVADGVSAWAADSPTVAGDYARTFLKHCTEALENSIATTPASAATSNLAAPASPITAAAAADPTPPDSSLNTPSSAADAAAAFDRPDSDPFAVASDPVSVMAYAQQQMRQAGSAVLAALQPGGKLSIASLGDCRVLLLRSGSVVAETVCQMHGDGDSKPYQLSHPDFTNNADKAEDAERYTWDVEEGDVIIAGSDGLFDNLWRHEMLDLTHQALSGYITRPDNQASSTAAPPTGSNTTVNAQTKQGGPACNGRGHVTSFGGAASRRSSAAASAGGAKAEPEFLEAAVGYAADLLASTAAKHAASRWFRRPAAQAAVRASCMSWLLLRGGRMDDVTCVMAVVTNRGSLESGGGSGSAVAISASCGAADDVECISVTAALVGTAGEAAAPAVPESQLAAAAAAEGAGAGEGAAAAAGEGAAAAAGEGAAEPTDDPRAVQHDNVTDSQPNSQQGAATPAAQQQSSAKPSTLTGPDTTSSQPAHVQPLVERGGSSNSKHRSSSSSSSSRVGHAPQRRRASSSASVHSSVPRGLTYNALRKTSSAAKLSATSSASSSSLNTAPSLLTPKLGDSPTYAQLLSKKSSSSKLLAAAAAAGIGRGIGDSPSRSPLIQASAPAAAAAGPEGWAKNTTATAGTAAAVSTIKLSSMLLAAAKGSGSAPLVAPDAPAQLEPAGVDSQGNQLYIGSRVAVASEHGVVCVGVVKVLRGQKLNRWEAGKVDVEGHVGVGEIRVERSMEAAARQTMFWVKYEPYGLYGGHPNYTFWSKRDVLHKGINISIPCSSLRFIK